MSILHLNRCYPIACFPSGTVVQNLSANAGDKKDAGSIPGHGRCPGVGNGNSLQYSCLENSTYRGAWWATVHGVPEWDTTEHTNTQTHPTAFPKGWNTQQFHQQGLRWLCSLYEIKRTFNGPANLMLPCWFLFLLLLKDVIDYEWCIPPLRTSKNQGGASQVAQRVKESACNAGDLITIPGLGRSPGGGHRNPL